MESTCAAVKGAIVASVPFTVAVTETVPVEEHDISVDAVVTEDAVIHCRTEGGAK